MRCAIISDIHANWQAWQAVRQDIELRAVDSTICLGDIVGYGPRPAEVLADVRGFCQHFVIGNHDAAAAGAIDAGLFNGDARRIIEWTASQLDDAARQWLGETPLIVEADDLVFVHAETPDPAEFAYVEDEEDARACFAASGGRIIWFGHTHVPCVFMLKPDGEIVRKKARDFRCAPGARYLINTGSVGDPGDGRSVASYCIYDGESNHVQFRSVKFDLDGFRSDLAATGQGFTPWFLRASTKTEAGHVREHFATVDKVANLQVQDVALTKVKIAHTALSAQIMSQAFRKAKTPKRSRGLPFAILFALAALGGLAFYGWRHMRTHGGASAATAIDTAPPAQFEWSGVDVGDVGLAGSMTHSAGVFTVAGGGWDIWSTTDAFHFVEQVLEGDGVISVRVQSQEAADGWSKAGVMMRESIVSHSPHAMMIVTPSNGVVFQCRNEYRGVSRTSASNKSRAPWWVRLQRSGDTISGYASPDGTKWTLSDKTTITNLTENLFWGIIVTSHTTARTSTVVFDNLTVSNVPRPPPAVTTNPPAPPATNNNVVAAESPATTPVQALVTNDNAQSPAPANEMTNQPPVAPPAPAQPAEEKAVAVPVAPPPPQPVKPASAVAAAVEKIIGDAIVLDPRKAQLHGGVQLDQANPPGFANWKSGKRDWVTWDQVDIPKAGIWRITGEMAGPNANVMLRFSCGRDFIDAKSPATGAFTQYVPVDFGRLRISRAGLMQIGLRAQNPAGWKPVNIRAIKLTPVAP